MNSDTHLTGYLYIIKMLYSTQVLQVHNEASLCKMYNTCMKYACPNNIVCSYVYYACAHACMQHAGI